MTLIAKLSAIVDAIAEITAAIPAVTTLLTDFSAFLDTV